jgi:hypothetical protein
MVRASPADGRGGAPMIVSILLGLAVQDRDPEAVRKDVHDILQRPEFRENLPTDFWVKLREYLKIRNQKPKEIDPKDLPDIKVKPPSTSIDIGAIMRLLFVIALAILLAFIIFLVYQWWAKRAKPDDDAGVPLADAESQGELPNALSQTADQWAADAERLFRQGKISEAIRALYLAVLSFSHRRNWIDYHPCKTNWEYIRKFAGPSDGKQTLRLLTGVFERAWYGKEACGETEYRESKRLAGELSASGGAPA